MTYQFLSHTADIGIKITNNSLTSAFEESVVALLELIFGKKIRNLRSTEIEQTIEVNGYDLDSLFINFMNEILFLIDGKKIIPLKLKVEFTSKSSLKFKFQPYYFSIEQFPIQIYVKAVTYHQLEIKSSENSTEINFYLDI